MTLLTNNYTINNVHHWTCDAIIRPLQFEIDSPGNRTQNPNSGLRNIQETKNTESEDTNQGENLTRNTRTNEHESKGKLIQNTREAYEGTRVGET